MLSRTTPVAYNHCPDCGLSVPLRALYLALDVCPRCLARRRVARPMTLASAEESGTAGHRCEGPLAQDVPALAQDVPAAA